MIDWKTLTGSLIGVAAGLGVTGYGAEAGNIVVTLIGAGSTLAVAVVGAWPAVLKAQAGKHAVFAKQMEAEREALHEEHRSLVADLRAEIKRLRELNDQLEARLRRCEKEQDSLIGKIKEMKQGIFSDTDLEVARILNERKHRKEEDDET